jgi:hypothetical protein
LHAERLAFRHPFTGVALDFRVPLPEDLERWLGSLGAGRAAEVRPAESEGGAAEGDAG